MLPETDLTDSASLPEGSLKVFPTPHDGPPVLLTRQQGQVYAFAAHCPHYGAPLEKGQVVGGKLICPWHHACFKLDSGHLCEPPALDDLPAFAVREAEGRIWVQLPGRPAPDKPEATLTAEVGGIPPAPQGKRIKIQGTFGGTHRTTRRDFVFGSGSWFRVAPAAD